MITMFGSFSAAGAGIAATVDNAKKNDICSDCVMLCINPALRKFFRIIRSDMLIMLRGYIEDMFVKLPGNLAIGDFYPGRFVKEASQQVNYPFLPLHSFPPN